MTGKPYTEIRDSDRTSLVEQTGAAINELVDVVGAVNKAAADPATFKFNYVRNYLTGFGATAAEARQVDMNWLPSISLIEIQDLAVLCNKSLRGLLEFQNGGGGNEIHFARAVLESTNQFHAKMAPFVGYAAGRDRVTLKKAQELLGEAQNQAAMLNNEARDALHRAEVIQKPILDRLTALQEDAARIVREMRAASAQAGVSAHAEAFRRAAKKYGCSANAWMAVTLVVGAVAVCGLTWWLHYDPVPMKSEGGAIAQHVLLRAVVILFGVFFTVWAARNHRAERHLNVVNEHRALALDTFQTFVEATASNAVRDQILLATTGAIFSPGMTGYVGGEDDSSAEKLMALVKLAAGGKGD
jgi:hypothetical protein